MKYTQNKKLLQITEKILVIGVDIAKEIHVARAQDYRGIEFGKPLQFENTRNGLNTFLKWANELRSKHGKEDIIVGMEPTGHYWLNFAYFLKKHSIRLVVVNPYHVKRSKELDDNSPTKNDIKDAKTIAQLVKDGRFSEPHIPEGIYSELRIAMDIRERLNNDLVRIKIRFKQWLDRFFPEFMDVFSSWEGKAALMTLKEFPLPDKIVNLGPDKILACWKKGIKRAVGIKRAIKLVEAAKRTIGIKEGLEMGEMELKCMIEQYEIYNKQLTDIEAKIEELALKVPGIKEMLSIKGVGIITAAGFIAEAGDLSRYQHPRQIQKLAGLSLKENSSGKHKGKTTISKRGRRRLRSLLFRAIMPIVAKNEEFRELHRYYTTREKNPLKKKQSLIVLCCKLIRIFFALASKKAQYDSQKMMGDIKRSALQNAA